MGAWTLIAHADGDLRVEIERAIHETLGPWAGRMVHAGHAQEAQAAFVSNNKDICRLVVIGADLPEDAATPMSASRPSCGIETVRQLRPPKMREPGGSGGPFFAGQVAFVADYVDTERLCEMRDLLPFEFMTLGSGWGEKLEKFLSTVQDASDSRDSTATREWSPPRGLNLDMELLGQWKWHIGGGGIEDTGHFNVNRRTLKNVQDLGQVLAEMHGGSSWDRLFGVLGAQLNELFFSNAINNVSLVQSILKFGARNARVRFIVDDTTHELILEALQDPDETDARNSQTSFWMLKAPIYRRYDRRGENFPLFKDTASRLGKINCLIIAADPAECRLHAPWNTPLEELPQLVNEAEAVRAILEKEKTRSDRGVGRVEMFLASEHPADDANPKATSDALKSVLERGPWHLVHFVGHAVRSRDAGALVLGGPAGTVLTADFFATVLARAQTQFLYLSSCKSADAYFVMRLVEQRLPAVLGFRWPVKDESALVCAKHFYSALFQGSSRKYLEYALLDAKQKLHDDRLNEPVPDSTWASPVLVMQVDKAQDDSRYQAMGVASASPEARSALH